MLLPDRVDVMVIGGGPAGSTAATQLARAGYSVTLVDKQYHPRETVGESVLPSAWKYFDLLGVTEAIERHGFVRKAGGVVAWGNQLTQIAFRDFDYRRPGLHVERDELDHLLLSHARSFGTNVIEGVRAENFAIDDTGGVSVSLVVAETGEHKRTNCRFLIDATGQGSLVARQLGCRRLNPEFRFVSLWGYFGNAHYVSSGGIVRHHNEMAEHPPMTFITRLGDWGWSWHIPLKVVTSVGLVIPIEEYKRASSAHASLDDYFLERCRTATHLQDLLVGSTLTNGAVRILRDFSYLSDTISGPGFFVVGDAAGFVDPIFSIGVVIALYSGHLAAWAVDRVLRRPALEASSRSLFESQMRGRYQLAHMMALPGVDATAPPEARTYFDFFSRSEQELMWSAASMTTRSSNLVRTSSSGAVPVVLKRREIEQIRFN